MLFASAMLRPGVLALTLGLLAAASLPAHGEVTLEANAGYFFDVEEPYIGFGLDIPVGERWTVSPNVEYVFVDNGDLYVINVDFIYDYQVGHGFRVWSGVGPALVVADYEVGRRSIDDTDLGLNVLGGVAYEAGRIDPYIQLKFTFADETETVLTAGIRF